MNRRKAPRLAAAFVLTISAGCGGAAQEPEKPEPENQDWVPNLGSVKENFTRNEDGTCSITRAANPPYVEQVDCETREPIEKR